MSLLNVRNLTVQFHTDGGIIRVADRVSLHVEPGEIVGLIGESGCGKSTLMRAIMGVLPPQAEMSCDELEFTDGVSRAAMVFQDPLTYLNPSLKVGMQLRETISRHQGHMSRQEVDARVAELLHMVDIRQTKNVLGKYPFELSGGQRQRIVLAIALACEPTLLIADEPTTALDVTVQRQLLSRLGRIASERKMAVLIVSHDFGVIASLAERVMVMQDGRIVESGAVEQIYHEPQEPYTKSLIENARAIALPQRQSAVKTGKRLPENIEQLPEIIRLEHISKQYQNFGLWKRKQPEETVQDISLAMSVGESFGLVGESGCGKTTLARILCGLTEPTSGQMYYKGEKIMSIAKGRTKEQSRAIQMVFQSPYASLNPRHTIGKTLEEPLLLNGVHSREMRLESVREILRKVGLSEETMYKYPSEFSGGQKQRIAIARALLSKPSLLVLDEPVSALDLTTQRQILELLRQIRKEQSLTWIFISHDLQVIRNMCGRLGVMYAGRIVESGNTKDIYEEPWHPYTKLLLQSVLVPEPKRAKRKQKIWMGGEWIPESSGQGCSFAGRCGYAMECCRKEQPQSYRYGEREVSCFLYSREHTGKRSADYRMTTQI